MPLTSLTFIHQFPLSRPFCRQPIPHSRPNLFHSPSIRATISNPTTTTSPTSSPAPKSPTFNWHSQWYPLALIKDLDPSSPTRITILSQNLVVWQNLSKTWSVFHDRCPHRFAALSEGVSKSIFIQPSTRQKPSPQFSQLFLQRIDESGRLECGYHGWQFDADGSCTRIPQSPANPAAFSAPACASALASVQRTGILFAWLGQKPPLENQLPQTIDDQRAQFVTSAFSRTLPLCFTTFLQNILDPAHIHFAHHDQIGRRELAAPLPIRILQSRSPSGFTADYYSGRVRVRFRPPCLVEIVTAQGLSFAYYAVPVRPGLVNTIAIRGCSRPPLFVLPRWLDHLKRNSLVEGDLELMITQEAEMRKEATRKGKRNLPDVWGDFHMPTSADRLIVEMRQWFAAYAPGEDADWYWGGNSDREDWHGRFAGHVSSCSACSAVFRRLKQLKQVAKAGALIFGLAFFAAGELAGVEAMWRWLLFGGALLCAGLHVGSDVVRKRLK